MYIIQILFSVYLIRVNEMFGIRRLNRVLNLHTLYCKEERWGGNYSNAFSKSREKYCI